MRERDKLRKRLWREKNPEKEKEIKNRFESNHPGYFAKKMAEYRKKDPEKFRQSNRECYKVHRKERRQKLLQSWKKNPELKKRYEISHAKTMSKFKKKYNKNKLQKYYLQRDRIVGLRKIKRQLVKLEVMSYYSKGMPKCNNCGETIIDFLNIDHIKPRKEHGHPMTFGSEKIYKWLIRKNFPKGFQILCWNCNMIKQFQIREPKLSQKPQRIKEREWKRQFKNQVFAHYSNGKPTCACCGFVKLEGLSIDHLISIKESNHDRTLRSHRLYQWLKRNKFPKDYQVLCINCNSAKGTYGRCPHLHV